MNIPTESTETGVGREVRCEMTGVDNLLADVLFQLPRCNVEIEMRKTIAMVIQNFCRETGAFQYTTEEASVVDQQQDYEIIIPFEADISVIKQVKQYGYDNDSVKAKVPTIIWNGAYEIIDTLSVDPVYVRFDPVLAASTTNVSTLQIDLELIPSYDEMIGENACSLPDKLVRKWRQAFVSGAVFSLASMTGKGWSNKGLADQHKIIMDTLYSEAIDKTRINNMNKGTATMRAQNQWV